jgi:hypothetical protein
MGMTMVSRRLLFASDYAQIDIAREHIECVAIDDLHIPSVSTLHDAPRSQSSEPLAWGGERDARVCGHVGVNHWKIYFVRGLAFGRSTSGGTTRASESVRLFASKNARRWACRVRGIAW